jgi:predicted transcriptional regulator
MSFSTKTKSGKLAAALAAGETLTASQITKRFGIKNPTATVSALRYSGMVVYANSRKAGNGVQVTEYRTGRPTRKLISAGYKALAMGLV